MTKPLTRAETAWLVALQAMLDKPPSRRLGFYTTGDRDVAVYDLSKEDQINETLDTAHVEFCGAVDRHDARLGRLRFPAPVHSTSG
ncbi:MAG TPA: hypothetical protein DDW89_08935 [Gammaproteobacteria bacterium]|nr:hypothetical protein [Gammaproteobacteria bacterium]